jgi:hypothetical protein
MSEALEHLLDCPFCGSPAELQEWEERDATLWAAQVNCTSCRAEGPRGYANNDLGCYDAVNDLHKKRAIEAWNSRSAATHKAELYDCLRVQAEKMGFGSISDAFDAAMAARSTVGKEPEAHIQYSDELTPRTAGEKAAYREGVKDGKMYAVRDGLTGASAQKKATIESLLIEIDCKAQAGLEGDNNFGTRGLYLKEIRALIQANKGMQ